MGKEFGEGEKEKINLLKDIKSKVFYSLMHVMNTHSQGAIYVTNSPQAEHFLSLQIQMQNRPKTWASKLFEYNA